MAWKARLFMELVLTVMLIAIASPAMAGDNNCQERREDRRRELHENDFLSYGHDNTFHECCDGYFVPWFYFVADDLEYCFWEYEGEGEWKYECEDRD